MDVRRHKLETMRRSKLSTSERTASICRRTGWSTASQQPRRASTAWPTVDYDVAIVIAPVTDVAIEDLLEQASFIAPVRARRGLRCQRPRGRCRALHAARRLRRRRSGRRCSRQNPGGRGRLPQPAGRSSKASRGARCWWEPARDPTHRGSDPAGRRRRSTVLITGETGTGKEVVARACTWPARAPSSR